MMQLQSCRSVSWCQMLTASWPSTGPSTRRQSRSLQVPGKTTTPNFMGLAARRPLPLGKGGSAASPFRFYQAVRENKARNKALTNTISCKLDARGHDRTLAATQHAFNQAETWIAQVCWEGNITNANTAHHRVCGHTRDRCGLGAQLAVCARATAVEAIQAVKAKHQQTCPQFGPHGSIRYDAHTYRL